MHPALSIVAFTTLSGAGYGLLAVLALGGLLGTVPADPRLGGLGLGLGLALVTIGLVSSTLHLRHPERAWRALTQWRSSWLSREGVAAILTYPPALWLLWAWAASGEPSRPAAALTAGLAILTIYCTGQIYASLKPIPRWHHRLTTPCYLLLGLASGGVLAMLTARLAGLAPLWIDVLAISIPPIAWLVKLAWWRATDAAPALATAAAATGLEGDVRLLEPPHTGASYLTDEMAFVVARKHAARLRHLAMNLGCWAAWSLVVATAIVGTGWLATGTAALAAAATLAGTLIERWLFFAEARHTVTLYYGAATV